MTPAERPPLVTTDATDWVEGEEEVTADGFDVVILSADSMLYHDNPT